jgi:hypothetical protein
MKDDTMNLITEITSMIQNGKALEAFEKYYDETVVMQENETEPRIGKEANRKYEEAFFGSIAEWRKASVKSISVGNDVSAVEWEMEMVHKQYGPISRKQVAIQKWRNGKIVSEKFYYSA